MAEKKKKGVYKVSNVEISPAKNGFVVSYYLDSKNKSSKNQFDSWNYLGKKTEVFKADEEDAAMARMASLLKMSVNSGENGVKEYAPSTMIEDED